MLIFLLGISNWMSCCVSIFFYFDPCSQICEHLDVMTNIGLFILVIWFIDNKSIGTGNSDQDTCMRDKNKKTSKSWETLRTLNWLSSLESNICQYRWKQLKYTDKVQCHRVVKTFLFAHFLYSQLFDVPDHASLSQFTKGFLSSSIIQSFVCPLGIRLLRLILVLILYS